MANLVYMRQSDGRVFSTENPQYHSQDERINVKEGKAAVKQQAVDQLLSILKPGQDVYTLVKHVSSSGMSRRIEVLIAGSDAFGDPEIRNITGYAAEAIGWAWHRDGGVVVSGCGMDMGFHLVDTLSHAIGIHLQQRWL